MNLKVSLAAASLGLAMLAIPAVSSAAALPGASQSTAQLGHQSTMTETVAWGRCRAWRQECSVRWGWGGPRFRRCMWRHGC